MIPSIRQTRLRLWFVAVIVAVCGVLLLLLNSPPAEANTRLEFALDPGNSVPAGIWSNSSTIWVVNDGNGAGNKIYAYHRSDASRDHNKDFNTLNAAGNNDPRGIWSDGTTMFVVDDEDEKVYAYKMSDRKRDSTKDITLSLERLTKSPHGIWGDENTIWVANDGGGHTYIDQAQTRIYAYKRSNGSRDSGKDVWLADFQEAEETDWQVRGMWSDGVTMWLVDVKAQRTRAYKLSDGSRAADQEFPIRVTSAQDCAGYIAGSTLFGDCAGGGAWSDGETLFVTDNGANIVRGFPLLRRPINLDSSNSAPKGICADSDTYWLANDAPSSDPDTNNKLFAYKRSDDSRNSNKDFDTLQTAGNQDPGGIWCDGQTMYVVDDEDGKVYAYKMSDESRDADKDIPLHTSHTAPRGIWGSSTTIWVTNDGSGTGDKIYAYNRSGGAPDSSSDFDTLNAAGNIQPRGVWSNGTTMYVVDDEDEKVYAYRLSDKARDPSRDIPLTSTNRDAYGAWSDGDTLYVTDTADKLVYYYPFQHPALGQPGISGTPQVFRTVTAEASASNFTDTNGVSTRVRFSYQWIRSGGGDTDIRGATERTYRATLEDEGKRLKVRVRFFDDDGYEELRTSEASATVLPRPANIRATGQPSISGKEQEKQTLTGRVDAISDGNGIPADVEYFYQWIRIDGGVDTEIAGATERTYKPVQEDVGKELKVRVSFFDSLFYEESLTSAPVGPVSPEPNKTATGKPTILGSAVVRVTLAVDTSPISDGNGIPADVEYSYQWIRIEGTNETNIAGATQPTYRLVGADGGKKVRVRVGFTDIDGYEESRTSDSTGAVLPLMNLDPTGRPAVSGLEFVGRTLTADTSGISDGNGLTGAEFSHQWLRRDGGNDSEIAGATQSTYRLVAADEGKQLKVRVTYTDDGGNTETLTSDASGTVLARPNNMSATGKPIITGTPRVGEPLMADTSGITDENIAGENSLPADDVFSYQWIRSDGGADSEIDDATQSTYTPVLDDAGKQLMVRVSFADLDGYQESLTSDPTAATKGPIGSSVLDLSGVYQSAVGIWGNEETVWVAVEIQTFFGDQARIEAYRRSDGERDSGRDFSTLHAAGNRNPKGIWSDGVTMFVVDSSDNKVYAYTVSDKSRDESKEFDLAKAHETPAGTWGNATTIWVASNDSGDSDDAILAYSRLDDPGTPDDDEYGTRDSLQDFTLGAGGSQNPKGIWSDGETMWVVDGTDGKVYAYRMAGSRQPSRDINLTAANGTPGGAWGGGSKLLVTDGTKLSSGGELFPYDLPYAATGAPTISGPTRVYETLRAETSGIMDENGIPDDVVYSYQWIRVDGGSETDIARAAESSYRMNPGDEGMQIKVRVSFTDHAGYGESVTSAPTDMVEPSDCPADTKPVIVGTPRVGETLTADASCIRGVFNFEEEDLTYFWYREDSSMGGLPPAPGMEEWKRIEGAGNYDSTYRLRYRDEGKRIMVRVSWASGLSGRFRLSEATVPILPGPVRGGFDLTRGGAVPLDGLSGIWGNEETIWVSNDGIFTPTRLYAYDRSDGSRDPGRDIRLQTGADPHINWAKYNEDPRGIWSDGDTMFVVDIWDSKVYAYDLATGDYDPDKDVTLASDNNGATGIWGGDETIWVANSYNGDSTAERDGDAEKIFAYRRTDDSNTPENERGSRDPDKDFNALEAVGNQLPRGICSDGRTMWVLDSGTRYTEDPLRDNGYGLPVREYRSSTSVFAYNMSDKSRNGSREVNIHWSLVPRGAWCEIENSERGTLWVVDRGTRKLHTYRITVGATADSQEQAISPQATLGEEGEENREPLTAAFHYDETPGYHSGTSGPFTLWLVFSEAVFTTPEALKDQTLTVSDATVQAVSRVDDRSDLWKIRLMPVSDRYVSVLLHPAADCDAAAAVCTEDGRTLGYAIGTIIPGPPPNTQATGAPVINGIVRVGETLTADVTGIADRDRLENAVFSYRWLRNDGTGDTEIAGATGATYTLVSEDEVKTIKVEVSFTDDRNHEETLTSGATGKVEPDTPPGEPLFFSESWSYTEDGIELTWYRGPGSGVDEYVLYRRALPHEKLSAYATVLWSGDEMSFTDTDVEPGLAYLYRVAGVNSAGEGPKSSPLKAIVPGERPEAPSDLAAVYTEQGMALRWGAPANAAVTDYQVYRGKFRNDGGAHDGAVSKYVKIRADGDPMTYLDTDVERGEKYRYRVAAVNAAGEGFKTTWLDIYATSSETHVNTPPTGAPAIRGTGPPQVGGTLEADTSGIDDADGLTNPRFTYQWIRNDGTDDVEIAGATGDTYTLVADDAGKTLKVKVSFTDDWSHVETRTSAATPAVAATLPTEPLHLAVIKGSQIQELDASWQAPSSDGGSEILLYHVQWKEATGSWDTAADVSIDGVVGTTYTITGLTGGVEYAVRVLALNREGLGPTSHEATGTPAGGVSQQNVEPENNDPTGGPAIDGIARVGETLTADTSGIHDDDGLENVAFSYQWTRSDGGLDTNITGATGSTYTLVSADEGKTIKVTVFFTDAEGNPETLTSDPTGEVEAKPNTRATGAPAIDGIARVGETLKADTSGIDDADELTNVVFAYQWLADDADIAGATGAAYTLVAADEGKAIKVVVSFTDDRGNPETLASDPTGAVAPDPGPLTVFTLVDASTDPDTLLGTLEDGDTLTLAAPDSDIYGIRVDTDSNHDDHDDIQKVVLALSGAKDVSKPEKHSPYSLYGDSGADNLNGGNLPVGSYTLTATAHRANGDVLGTLTVSFTVEAQEQTAVPNNEPTGLPTIGGFARVGETLTADTSGIIDADGLTNVAFSYQWLRDDAKIAAATGATYTLVAADQGGTIKVTVSFTDGEGNPETLTSDPTGGVAPESGPLTAFTLVDTSTDPDTPLGTLEDGRTLTLAAPPGDSYGIRVDTDSNDDIRKVELALSGAKTEGKTEWEPPYSLYGDSGAENLTGEDLPAGSYDLTATAYKNNGDVLGTLKVSFSVAYAAPAEEQQPTQNTLATGAPAIDGVARVGETLTADTSGIIDDDGLDNAAFAYQWLRGDADIPGATGETYTLVKDDEGSTIKVKVSFTDAEGNPETLTSDATGVVTAKPNKEATGAPTIDGIARVGETLTADTSGIDDDDGLANVVFSYQWTRSDGSGDANIHDATGSSYTLTGDDEGRTIKVTVSFTDGEGNPETLTSDPTGGVAPESGPLTAFTVVDTSTDPDKTLGTLEDGIALTLGAPDSDNYGIRVDTESNDDIRKVELALSGAKTEGKTEWEPPYSLYGDSGEENLTGEDLPAGSYDLTATAYKNNGDVLGTLRVSFSVAYAAPAEEQPPAQNTLATGAPAIDGVARVGETLTADTSGIDDDDGLTNVAFSYQWLRGNAEIASATGETYSLVKADEGRTIKVTVSFTDAEGNPETLTSDPTGEVEAKPNTRATGAPAIDGMARVGETLTADTSGIHDDDGLTSVAFSYQWLRGNAEIAGATGETYTLVKADEGKTIKVTVSFTDAQGNHETLTSDATGVVTAKPNKEATGAPSIDGIARVRETLTADISGISDNDGLDNATFSYQWTRSDGGSDTNITGATGTTYTLVKADEGKTIKVTVSFTDAEGNPETLTSDPTSEVEAKPNTEATGALTISGIARVGETLTVDTSGIHDDDGLDNAVFAYQWLRGDAEITGAIGETYTLVDADEGKIIKVTVSFTDAEGNHETLTSDATGVVTAKPNKEATGAPTIDGIARVGETLTADTSGVTDDDGLDNVTFAYQWVRNDGNGDTEIQDATGSSYVLTGDDEGRTIKVTVSFTDAEGNPETLTSEATGVVEVKPNTEATGAPTIDGMAQVGETLTADTSGITDDDGLDNAVFSYQWLRGDAEIAGATGETYTLVEADVGRTVKVKVSFTDESGHAESLTSDPTGEVEAAETVPGRPQDLAGDASAHGIKLSWSAPSGSAVTQYVVYRGELENGSMNGRPMTEHATVEAAGEAMEYTDAGVESGVEYRYRVAAVNSAGEGRKSGWVNVRAGG